MVNLIFVILLTFSSQWVAEAQCSYHLEGPNGTFQSPNYPDKYPPFADCNWTISVSAGHVIALTFTVFHIADEFPCDFDKLLIRDGPDCLAPIKATLCGDRLPAPFISSGSTLYVQFLSSAFASAMGFNAIFTETADQSITTVAPLTCEYTLHSERGSIQPPNTFGNSECIWRIIVPFSARIKLTFEEFSLLSDCFLTHLDVYDGFNCSARITRQCGLKHPNPIESSGPNLILVFRTSGPVTFKGFKVTFAGFNETGAIAHDSAPVTVTYASFMVLLSVIIFINQEQKF